MIAALLAEIERRMDEMEAAGMSAAEILTAVEAGMSAALDRYAQPEDVLAYFRREADRSAATIASAAPALSGGRA
jgi:hypothetical protein